MPVQVSLNATIDGVPVSNLASYAETSPVVDWGDALPGSFGAIAGLTPGFTGDPACPSFDPNDLCPSVALGYWLMVNLPPGEHVISTGGTEDEIIPKGQGDQSTGCRVNIGGRRRLPTPSMSLFLSPPRRCCSCLRCL